MEVVLLTALGVGGATLFGSALGFIFKKITHKFSDIVISFAAGIMFCAAAVGLVIPSIEHGATFFESFQINGKWGLVFAVAGIVLGSLFVHLLDKFVPHVHKMLGADTDGHDKSKLSKVILFVLAIAIHNLPEGLAAGVGFGSGNTGQALIIAGGIALQNIPEGMVIIGPMLSAGVSKGKTFLCALITGLVEVVGTLIGYFTVYVSTAILPFALAFAGGTMIYIISDEMIPETHGHGSARGATFSFIIGFCIMLIMDVLLG
ncbi:MAG: ZIP family metal transporter [Clostridia bacterium]|nr:ZIP family metal transporter [Clostridia bacterium]